jgi:hypothetical protein
MKTYVQAEGFDVWKSIVDEYKDPATPPTDNDGNKLSQNNSRLCIVILKRRFGTNFRMFMKEVPKSRKLSFRLTKVNLKG